MSSGYDAIATDGGSPGNHCVGAPTKGGLHAALVERELAGGESSRERCQPNATTRSQPRREFGAFHGSPLDVPLPRSTKESEYVH